MTRAARFSVFSAVRFLFAICLFFAAVRPFAQQIQQPEFKAKAFPNGVLYTFLLPDSATIKYKLFEPLSGSYAEGTTSNGQSIFILNGITGAAWTETDEGKSLPVVLYPQAELPFADIDSAFISPAEGNWANKQPLVIDIPADYEAYYSLTSTDPLISGLAYDGPVFIDMTGTVTVYIALVAPNGTIFSKSITYSVADYTAFQPLNSEKPVIYCGPKAPIRIPTSMKYHFGNAEQALQPGTEIAPGRPGDILRYVPLVIEDRRDKYRYVLQTGGESSGVKAIPPVNGIEFYEWNFFSFSVGSQVSYSVDGSPWLQYMNPVYIDRTKPHTIAWASAAFKHGQVQVLQLPPKPHLIGVPQNSITNMPVTLSISDKGFVLRHETAKHKSDFLHSMFFDVLPGEEYAFNTDLAVYYNGIRQGTLAAQFTIDKQPTSTPVLSSSAETYSRKPVELTVKSDNEVLVRIFEHEVELQMGKHPDFSVLAKSDRKEAFIPLEGGVIRLPGKEKTAVLYRVEAYNKNKAGNTSFVVSYEVCVNTYSIFVSASKNNGGIGSPFKPLSSFATAIAESQLQKFSKIVVSGTHEKLSSFTIDNQCEIAAASTEPAVLKFSQSAAISVKNGASLTIQSVTVSQESSLSQVLANHAFFNIQKAFLTLEDCTLQLAQSDSQTALYSYDSSVTVKNSNLSVSSVSYCTAVEAVDSNIYFDTSKVLCNASATELFTLSGGQFTLNKSDCTIAADVGRIAGLENVSYDITENKFSKTGGSVRTMQHAVQANNSSSERAYSGNSISGFTPGLSRIR